MGSVTRAFLLLILAATASWAGSAKEKVDDLSGQVASPEDFQSFVEGSVQRQGNPEGPSAAPRASAGQTKALPPLSAPHDRFSRDRNAAPPMPLADLSQRPSKSGRSVLVAEGLGGVLGVTGLMLFALAGSEPTVRTSMAAEPLPRFESPRPKPAVQSTPARTEPLFDDLPPFVPDTKPYFVDTRMPVSTWRAISLPEQKLIEQWDNSREKALGVASLSEWVAAKGPAAGIDAARLQAKLERDA